MLVFLCVPLSAFLVILSLAAHFDCCCCCCHEPALLVLLPDVANSAYCCWFCFARVEFSTGVLNLMFVAESEAEAAVASDWD